MSSRAGALVGSALFLIIAPGTIAGILPWLIGGWRFEHDFGSSPIVELAGILLVLVGAAGLVESFVRIAWHGLGTPAPIAPTERLIVSGFYRHVRNPMYVAVVLLISGQALLFGQLELVIYAALVWLGFHLFVLFYEEPALRRQFPTYLPYSRAVPRWLPLRKPWNGGA